ncbi:MAG: hypothetical protein ACTHU0_06050 [Kofleriaceae bacterium]
MRNFRQFPWSMLAFVCLSFTGSAVAWAEESPRPSLYVEDPMAPHDTTGTTARAGTAVGFIYGEQLDVLALGGTFAVGHRWGRLALEAEYSYLTFQVKGPSSLRLGDGQRLGVIGRLDFLRIGPRYVGGNSLLSFYVEGGASVAWNDWYTPAWDEAARLVPADTKRVEGQVGFGIQLDHRLQEPIGFPHRIGWFLGWRMALAPHEAEAASICRGSTCRPVPRMTEERFTDRSMLFQSSVSVTW